MHDSAQGLFARLERLVVERPREAREAVGQALDNEDPELSTFLTRIGGAGESRLRHLVATAIRMKPTRAKAVPQLTKWLAAETDEFTKNALRAALEALGTDPERELASIRSDDVQPVDPRFLYAYRYAASRLAHRVRNSLTEPQATILKLKHAISELPETASREAIYKLASELDAGFQRVARTAEYSVNDDVHFEMRNIVLLDWLRRMNVEYSQRFTPIDLTLEPETLGVLDVRVRASDYLLQLIFWNLWVNAQQSASGACRITVLVSLEGPAVKLLVVDNGDGFPPEVVDVVFVENFSTKGKGRGRGLLEVQDAVGRLHGDVHLVDDSGRHRLCLKFPREGTL